MLRQLVYVLMLAIVRAYNISSVKVGFVPTVLPKDPVQVTYFSIAIPANIPVIITLEEHCWGSCSAYKNDTTLKQGFIPSITDFDYNSFPVHIKAHDEQRIFYGMSNITSNETYAISILPEPDIQIFTSDSIAQFNSSLASPKMLMIVITIKFKNEQPTEALDLLRVYDHLYLSGYDSTLFIKP
jgi:hypothetical protein